MENDDTPTGEVEGSGDDQKVTIGGVEMPADEAKELIESGKSMKQLKDTYPEIDFNEMPKAFTQTRQKLAELEKLQAKPKEDLTDSEAKRLKEIDDFFDDPHVKQRLDKLTGEKEQQIKEDLSFQKTMESLEAEFDGSDGRPKFDRMEVLKYGQENQIFNPRTAYKELHEKKLDEWKLDQKLNKRRPTTHFERRPGSGGKQPDAAKQPQTFREATAAALAENE